MFEFVVRGGKNECIKWRFRSVRAIAVSNDFVDNDDVDNKFFSFVCDTRRIHNFYFKWVLKTRVNNMEHEQIFQSTKK